MSEIQLLIAAVGGLTAALVALWARSETFHAGVARRLADCEKDRLDLWRHLAGLRRGGAGRKGPPAEPDAQPEGGA